ncbi:MAG: hypothetical protein R2772_07590 [Chitinophagales bacterium]
MKNVTRTEILMAIDQIDKDPKQATLRKSLKYDLNYEGRSYPPILVLSLANQILGGDKLFLSDFNNSIKKPFELLKEVRI